MCIRKNKITCLKIIINVCNTTKLKKSILSLKKSHAKGLFEKYRYFH